MLLLPWLKSEAAKYMFYGLIFGLIFPILAIGLDLKKQHLDASWQSVVLIHKNQSIHFIIDTIPFILALFAMAIGRNIDTLKEKNKQILRIPKIKQDFLANISREIRTPMVGIIGMIDLLSKNTSLNSLQQEYVKTIHQSSFNLLDILNQISDFSKMESGKLDLSLSHINLKNVINQNLYLFFDTAQEKQIDLTLDYSESLPENILVDGNRLTQVISNLIRNAIKFTEQGSIAVKATKVSQQNDQIKIKISVIDSGTGIDKKKQENLFNRFTHFNSNTYNQDIRSELGLSVCKKIVNLMNGEIGVHSELNKGSTFWFTFLAQAITSNLIQESYVESKSQHYNLHILLVEDSDINVLVSQQILKHLGCTVDVAKDGLKAINMFEENKYDLILMDINLPRLDGIQTSTMIRKKHKKIPPIIAITSNALAGDAEGYINKGLDDCIAKPFTTETLNNKLQNWFGNHMKHH